MIRQRRHGWPWSSARTRLHGSWPCGCSAPTGRRRRRRRSRHPPQCRPPGAPALVGQQAAAGACPAALPKPPPTAWRLHRWSGPRSWGAALPGRKTPHCRPGQRSMQGMQLGACEGAFSFHTDTVVSMGLQPGSLACAAPASAIAALAASASEPPAGSGPGANPPALAAAGPREGLLVGCAAARAQASSTSSAPAVGGSAAQRGLSAVKLSLATAWCFSAEYFLRTACMGLLSASSRRPHISLAHSLTACSGTLACLARAEGHAGCLRRSLLLSRTAAAARCDGVYLTILYSTKVSSSRYCATSRCASLQPFASW
mmetsp:Transcript_19665/g.57103  ORF Transcript_19665/g.57103 Transcript_19665/m.57103 type:complete len:315 (-) Transcript_19665:74-1018(-)